MPVKKSYIDCSDFFCGAGGSTDGAKKAGVDVTLALNHWKLATETYSTNNQNALVDCTDISACDPRRYPSTHIAIMSPECTNHTIAKGVKIAKKQMDLFNTGKLDASAERSRATMWDVCRFAEYHQYNVIVVENVVDAREWVMFDAWLQAMYAMNYLHKCVYLNSQHCHPTPQSRDRMYVIFWKKGNKPPDLDFTPLAPCKHCGKDVNAVQSWKRPDRKYGKYNQQYVYCCPVHGAIVEPYYYGAGSCIDWSVPGKRIGDRKKDLSPNTKRRIVGALPLHPNDAFILKNEHSSVIHGMTRSINEPLQTQLTRQTMALIHYNRSQNPTGINQPIQTIATVEQNSLITFTEAKYEDCYYRMLMAREVKLAMAFEKNYIILGDAKEQVKQCGNAVTPPAMEMLIKRVVQSLN